MYKLLLTFCLIFLAFILASCKGSSLVSPEKPRTIITSDGEVDDMDSFIRFLLYANEFDVVGLVYSSSQWHYAGDGQGTLFTSPTNRRYGERTDLRWPGTTWMEEFIDEYAAVYDNLMKHDPAYPAPGYLKSIVKVGNIEFEGEMSKDTEGSDWIKSVLLDDGPGPVYVQVWGGTNTLARALKSIEDEYKDTPEWRDVYQKVSDKTIIYTVLDQDATYTKHVAPNWPDVKVIYNSAQFWSFAYSWTRVVPDELKVFMNGPWFAENIKFNHGPLLESYYLWGDGQKIEGDPEHTQGDTAQLTSRQRMQYDFISEGDSPSYFFLLNYGLRSREDPSYGGLGGRFVRNDSIPNRWEDGKHVTDFNPYTGQQETSYPQVRWIETLQNDFAARADWCVMDYDVANHAPVVTLDHAADLEAKAGDKIRLSGSAKDPDGNQLNYSWWQYIEAGTYDDAVAIEDANSAESSLVIPEDAETGDTIHIILEVTDNGTPNLSRYQRVIVTVK